MSQSHMAPDAPFTIDAAAVPEPDIAAGSDIAVDYVPCVACAEPIPKAARLCRHCKTRQDWTRHILDWKEVAGAVMAVLPLWAGAIALTAPLIQGKAPDLAVIDAACTDSSAVLTLTNSGEAPAVLGSMRLTAPWMDQSLHLRPEVDATRTIAAGGLETLSVQPTLEGNLAPMVRAGSRQPVTLTVDYVDFDGKMRRKTGPWPC